MVLEMIITILVDLITDPIKQYVVTPVKRHISYTFNCDGKVERLHHEVEQLQNKRVRLQQSVDHATRNGEEIYPNVTIWLSSAEKGIEEAEKLIHGKEEANKKCFVGFCPNLKTRYQLSKKAHKKALAIDKLQNAEGLDPIAFRPPLKPLVEPSMYLREALPSRVLILQQIMDALKDPNLNMIGVHGMGGVGKTTLAKEVLGQAVERKLFETAVLVAVSQTPELRRIQGEIADSLGLKYEAEEVPGRAGELHQRLMKVKVLIILDDVWQKLDLSAIGIPFGDTCEGCKILLTSRRRDVLSNEMCTQKEFLLDVLEEEETWRLFELSVRETIDAKLHTIANEVAKKCAGLPLLVLKVATDLRNKDTYAWKDMLNRLSRLDNTEIYGKVHKVIESSYEKLLDEEAKSLFLLCALFDSLSVHIQDLVIYCMGLGLFKHVDSIEVARNRVLTLIDKLKDECLLMDGPKAGCVKLHDVVRDIALSIASRVQHTFVGTSKVRSTDFRNKDCTRISLPYCDLLELPKVLECPEVEVFSLLNKGLDVDIPKSFFEGAMKLKVVDFFRVKFMSGLPSSLGFLTCLQTLSLYKCQLYNVPIIAELKQLELLSFAESNIAELPTEMKALTQLKLLDLRECRNLRVVSANVLSNMCLLEELYMLNSFDRWEVEGNASLAELKNLSHLTTLEIHVKDDKLLPDNWFFDGIRNYKISVGNWTWDSYVEYEKSRILKLELKTSIGLMHRFKDFLRGNEVLHLDEVKGIENLLYDSDSEKIDYAQLRILKIRKCDTLKNLFPISCDKCCPQLQELVVDCGYNIEAIVGESSEDEVIEFTQLTSLKLSLLPKITGFCKSTGTVYFPNLTSLEVYACNNLRYVFTPSMARSLKKLKRLHLNNCGSIEEILVGNKFQDIEEEIVFPELEYLRLRKLRNLDGFSSGYRIRFPKLTELYIIRCTFKSFVSKSSDDETLFNEMVTFSSLETIYISGMVGLRYLWSQQFADDDSFSKLNSLKITKWSTLSVVFPSNAYKRFQRLETLTLEDCDRVKEIYQYQAGVDFEETNSLQNLQSVEVKFCPLLKYLFPESIARGFLQLQDLKVCSAGIEMIVAETRDAGSESAPTFPFEWPEFKCLDVRYCEKLMKFSSNISNNKHDDPTQDSLYFIGKVIPNMEVLKLDDQIMKAIQSDGVPVELLWKLKEVTLNYLEEESVPFLFGFLRRIYSLENLSFYKCSLGERFSLDDGRKVGEQQEYHLRLKHLEFKNTDMKHILKKDFQHNLILQNLQTLNVEACHDLINVAPSSASFQNLTTLSVKFCNNMTNLVTTSTAKTMVHLVKLTVSDCKTMKEIVAGDGDCTENDEITFKKLKHLELFLLPSLNSFCSGNYIFNFPFLEKVSIGGCREMRTFCGGVSSTPNYSWKEVLTP